jgi:hypothetical protein
MSASDAAPLPRLGEVFFDVRGNSRSMRLSWYADTGVAVFSIWQGGRCTGTFRLPIDDLPRMIEILQRGPDRRRPRLQAADRSAGGYAAEAEPAAPDNAGYERPEAPADQYGEQYDAPRRYEAGEGAGSGEVADSYETAAYPRAEREPAARASRPGTRRRSAGYQDGEPYSDSPSDYASEYPAGHRESPPGYADSPLGYSAGRGYEDAPAGYQEPAGGYADSSTGYRGPHDAFGDPADHLGSGSRQRESRGYAAMPDYPAPAERQTGGFWQEEQDDYPSRSSGQEGLTDSHRAGFGQDRFVPPYVQAQSEAYPNDNQGTGASHRRSAGRPAYHADQGEDSADSDWVADDPWSDAGYSGGSDYRLPADPPPGARHSAGQSDDS